MPNIEDHIRKALEEGKFDDLPGKGKPIRWDDNPFVEADWQLAFRMLRNAGFALPWMDTRKEIESQLEAASEACLGLEADSNDCRAAARLCGG
jgi:hypothetical protein